MKKKIHRIVSTFKNETNLKQKILASYLILIILPLLVTTFLSYFHVSGTLIDQFQYSSDKALQQSSIYLNKIMDEIESSTDQICFNNTLSDKLRSVSSDDSIVAVYKNYLDASNLLNGVFTSDILYSVELFITGNDLFVSAASKGTAGISFISMNNDYAEALDEKLSSSSGKILYLTPRTIKSLSTGKETTVITGARYLKDAQDYSKLGILTVNINQQSLNSAIKDATILPGSFSLLFDQSGTAVAVSDEDLLNTYSLSPKQIFDHAADKQLSFFSGKEKLLINSLSLNFGSWTLVTITPYSEMLKTSTSTRNRMILIMSIVSLLFFIAAHYIANFITRRILFLSDRMREVHLDNYSPIDIDAGKDEIADLIDSYNYLLQKVNDYAASQYQLGIALKNTELKALQAQINPHFLYNTLDLINWSAMAHGADKISEIVQLLSRYYKLSLSKGVDIVPIQNAIQHIETYVKLQNFRFQNSIKLDLDLDPEIYSFGILKLLLQPIVENSILHGILEKENPEGTISIHGFRENNDIFIQITDDGVGMTQEQIRSIIDGSNITTNSSYGIQNIIERISICYGSDYGLTYESTPGHGTTVFVKIPCTDIPEN